MEGGREMVVIRPRKGGRTSEEQLEAIDRHRLELWVSQFCIGDIGQKR